MKLGTRARFSPAAKSALSMKKALLGVNSTATTVKEAARPVATTIDPCVARDAMKAAKIALRSVQNLKARALAAPSRAAKIALRLEQSLKARALAGPSRAAGVTKLPVGSPVTKYFLFKRIGERRCA
jgi:hypothetical protein